MKKRILAIISIVLLVLLYFATLLAAIINPDGNGQVFRGLLSLCVAVPILLWIFLYLHRLMMKNKKQYNEEVIKESEESKKED